MQAVQCQPYGLGFRTLGLGLGVEGLGLRSTKRTLRK